MFTFFCTRCGEKLKVPDDWLGRQVACAHCANVLTLPASADANGPVLIAVPGDGKDTLAEIAQALKPPPVDPADPLDELAEALRPPDRGANPLDELALAEKTHVSVALHKLCPVCGCSNIPAATRCTNCWHSFVHDFRR